MKYFNKIIFLFLLIILNTGLIAQSMEEGKTYHGFELKEKRFVSEVNADCYLFEHTESGAHLLKIAADDPNKTFMVAFKTNPETNCGTPHIMEHSVLNGSEKYPVKSPFDIIVKASLKTFVNAFTGDHLTAYPIASKNTKDYFNLMDLYLDAVFNPRIYDDPNILKQEGWHYELASVDEPVSYSGIVYNEMKGAYSSPTRELGYHVQKNLYPESNNRFSSGGYPEYIPNLTYDMFLDYHRKYYHPSNSYFLLYGNADLMKELEQINSGYLAGVTRSDLNLDFPLTKPFQQRKKVTAHYSTTEGSETKDQTYLTLNYVAGLNTNQKLLLALDLLTDILVNQESAPIRLALQEAGIGKDYRAYVDELNQNFVQIRVQNANPDEAAEFERIVDLTMKRIVEEGLDDEVVKATLNRLEFRLRETDDSQKGLSYGFTILNSWFFADNPFPALEYEKTLKELKNGIREGYLENIIEKYFISNPHSLLFTFEPEPGLETKKKEQTVKELQEYKASLSAAEIEKLAAETAELIAYQKEEDTPEALATIPMLGLSDVNPKAEFFAVDEKEVDGTKLLHYDAFSNNIAYAKFYYDLRVLPKELIPYASLLTALLPNLNTENYMYGDLDNALNMHTGGFNVTTTTYLENSNDENMIPKLLISTKAVTEKIPELFALTDEIINRSLLKDKERLGELIVRTQARVEANFQQNGLYYALNRMRSYYSNSGMFNELTDGYAYYTFLNSLVEEYKANPETVIGKLQKTASLLFKRNNLIVGLTAADKTADVFMKEMAVFTAKQPEGRVELSSWEFDFEKKNEAIKTASKVQFVLQGYDMKKLGYDWKGSMRVLQNIVSREYLYNKIRVIGGAYGGSSVFNSNGNIFFYSYRDPRLEETLETYRGIPDFVENFEADETGITGFILGAISNVDNPLTVSQQGNRAVGNYFRKVTYEDKQRERDEILATTAEDIRNFAPMLKDIVDQNNYSVYGNEDKIEENKDLFKGFLK